MNENLDTSLNGYHYGIAIFLFDFLLQDMYKQLRARKKSAGSDVRTLQFKIPSIVSLEPLINLLCIRNPFSLLPIRHEYKFHIDNEMQNDWNKERTCLNVQIKHDKSDEPR